MIKIYICFTLSVILLSGCGEQPPESKSRKKSKARLSAMGRDNTRSASKISKKATKTSSKKRSAADSVIDYGTGTTHLKIRRRKREQLRNIQNRRNAQINKTK